MENSTTWGSWIAYVAIGLFLLLLFAVILRTMMLFGALTLMPIARVLRRLRRVVQREP